MIDRKREQAVEESSRLALRTASSPLSYSNSISMELSSSDSAVPSPETSSISSEPIQTKVIEGGPYSTSSVAYITPKAISPRPSASMTIAAGPQRSR